MNRYSFLSLFLFIFYTCTIQLFAQPYAKKDRGLVTYRLGTDTTIMQVFEINKRHFNTTILSLSGQATKYEGRGELDEKGDLNKVLSKTFNLDSTGNWVLSSEATNIFTGDSSVYTVIKDGKITARRTVPAKGIVSNAADACSFFVFPYMGFFAPVRIGDTLFHCQLSFGECRTYQVARLGNKELKVGSNVMGRLKLLVDEKGRMQGGDAIGSSLNWVATVQRRKKDFYNLLNEVAMRKRATGSLAPRTFRDTSVYNAGNRKLEVDYWRPLRRNRDIFGAVVPWNRIWRTGANNATQLRSNIGLTAGGIHLPAGKYSLWTYPTETSWQLIINRKADVWGTEYDATADLVKLPLTVERTGMPVEVLKISLLPVDMNHVRIMIEWEYYKAWADIGIE